MKKILSTGIILLSATNFVTPVMAQSGETTIPTLTSATQYGEVDNSKNPMNTALGTVESQYPTTSLNTNSGTLLSNSGTLNNAQKAYFSSQIGQQMWKNFHCAMLAKGITWQAPTNLFANNATCGTNAVGGTLSISNPQLEYQRQLVRDYIARLSGGKVENNSTTPTVITEESAESYKKFVVELQNLEKKFPFFREGDIEKYIEDAAIIFNKFSNIPSEYRQRHLMKILQKYYRINDSQQNLESLAIKSNFAILTDWINKTKNLAENNIAWVDFGLVNGEFKITAEDKMNETIPYRPYNYKGNQLTTIGLDISVEFSSSTNPSLKAEISTDGSGNFNIKGEKLTPNDSANVTISVDHKQMTPAITTFPIKFVKALEAEEKTVSPTDTVVSLPDSFDWEIKNGLIQENTKVKVIAKIKGDSVFYSVVYANDINKKVIAEGEYEKTTKKSFDPNAEGHWSERNDELNNYFILKRFY